jgi:hypothetical protein
VNDYLDDALRKHWEERMRARGDEQRMDELRDNYKPLSTSGELSDWDKLFLKKVGVRW